jgi:hypothetical protein
MTAYEIANRSLQKNSYKISEKSSTNFAKGPVEWRSEEEALEAKMMTERERERKLRIISIYIIQVSNSNSNTSLSSSEDSLDGQIIMSYM